MPPNKQLVETGQINPSKLSKPSEEDTGDTSTGEPTNKGYL